MKWLVSAVCLIAGALGAQPTPFQKKHDAPARVVFVCEHGTVKSLVAVEYFNRLALARGLHAEAISRGTKPDSVIPGVVRTGLEADGFDVSAFRPQRFTRDDAVPAILVVALDAEVETVAGGFARIIRWDGLPSVTADYGGARNAIVTRIQQLVDSLARGQTRPGKPES
jgi:hypothetical protein